MPKTRLTPAAAAVLSVVESPEQAAAAIAAAIDELDPYYIEGAHMVAADDLRALSEELERLERLGAGGS